MNDVPRLPSNINIVDAPLPVAYEQAKAALAECYRLDECKDWADKTAALASYARQANDETLYDTAGRIRGRAVRRMGELLKEFDGRGDHMKSAGADTSQREAADAVGLSKRQQVDAVRVANIPQAEFESLIEREGGPPTVSELAERGKQSRLSALIMTETPAPPPRGWDAYKEATIFLGDVRHLADFCSTADPALIAGGLKDHEIAPVGANVETITVWLGAFWTALQKRKIA